MNRRALAALILINAVLLSALVISSLTPPALAQMGGRGNYMMISGKIRGRANQNAVYIIDQTSTRIVALTFNSANNRLELIAGRRVADDARTGGGAGVGR